MQAGILLQATKGGVLIDRLGGDFSIILTCSVRVDSEGVAGGVVSRACEKRGSGQIFRLL